MSKHYFIDLGILEPTKIYAIKLEEIAEIEGGNTLITIVDTLRNMGIEKIIVDPAHPKAIEQMMSDGLSVQKAKLL